MKDYVDKMNAEEARMFREAVVNIVSQIPCGKVTTYGHIATLAGWPSHSRMVGRTLRYTPECASLPCHRVVNAVGRTAPGWLKQRELLEAEGVTFKNNGQVDKLYEDIEIIFESVNEAGFIGIGLSNYARLVVDKKYGGRS